MAEPEAVPVLLSLAILRHIKTAQLQNGLRHGDFTRYRRFCARRLRRDRKNSAVQLTYGSKKTRGYVPHELTPEECVDVRHLCIPLMNAERAWGYAMQLKQDASLLGDDDSRRRFHLMRRLSKAASWSQKLRELCAARADDRTSLEAEAYAAWMTGNVLLEKEDWGSALAQFATAKRIYEQLASVGSAGQRELFRDRVEEIDPSIRYCQYNHSRETGEEVDLQSMRMLAGPKGGGGGIDLVQSKLEKVLSESRKQQALDSTDVRWKGEEVPVRSERIRLALLRARDAVQTVCTIEDPKSDEAVETKESRQQRRESAYLEAFSAYDEALSGVREEVGRVTKANKGAIGESLLEELTSIDGYVRFLKQRLGTRRIEMLAEQLVEKLDCRVSQDTPRSTVVRRRASSSQRVGETLQPPDRRTRPEDVVRLYQKALQGCSETVAMLTEVDEEQKAHVSAFAARLKACRCVFVAESYASRSPPQWSEAHVLYERTLDLVEEARDALQNCNVEDAADQNKSAAKLDALEKRARGGRCLAQACAFMACADALEEETGGVRASLEGVALDETDESSVKPATPSLTSRKRKAHLLDRLETFDGGVQMASLAGGTAASSASGGIAAVGSTVDLALPHALIATPPEMESIPAKPLFYDIVGEQLRAAPRLIERLESRAGHASKRKKKIKKQEGAANNEGDKGWFGGWFGGGKQ